MLKENLNKELQELNKEYEEVISKINHLKADGSLSELYNLNETFDETFDLFFNDETLRKKCKDWDYENDCMLLEKSNGDLLEELDGEDLKSYIEFYKNYLGELTDQLMDLEMDRESEEIENKIYQTWNRKNYTVQETDFDADLHCLEVVKNGEVIATIYPDTIEQMQEDIEALDRGEGVESWEDGNGNPVSYWLNEWESK